jgi:hypothetical protein
MIFWLSFRLPALRAPGLTIVRVWEEKMVTVNEGFENDRSGACIVWTQGDERSARPPAGWYRILISLRLCGSHPQQRRFWSVAHWVVDCVDERRARRLRARFGTRQWLVSWEPDSARAGLWRARLSCSSLVFTLERTGKTRTAAIARAARALEQLLVLRTVFENHPIQIGGGPEELDDFAG